MKEGQRAVPYDMIWDAARNDLGLAGKKGEQENKRNFHIPQVYVYCHFYLETAWEIVLALKPVKRPNSAAGAAKVEGTKAPLNLSQRCSHRITSQNARARKKLGVMHKKCLVNSHVSAFSSFAKKSFRLRRRSRPRSGLRLFFEIEGPEYTMPAHDLWPGEDTSSIFVLRRIIGEKLWQRI